LLNNGYQEKLFSCTQSLGDEATCCPQAKEV